MTKNPEEMRGCALEQLQKREKAMGASSFTSWSWVSNAFQGQWKWLQKHRTAIHQGKYLSTRSGKEVWQYTFPANQSGREIIFKTYDFTHIPLFARMGTSPALREAANFAALTTLGISCPPVLAVSETRHFGLLAEATIVVSYINNTWDGMTLGPAGVLREESGLRLAFCKKLVEQLARLHGCGGRHEACHAHKFLLAQNSTAEDPAITWIDVANCTFFPSVSESAYIPEDLVQLFVDLRLSTEECIALCEHYTKYFPNCVFSAEGLWKTITRLPPKR